MENKGKMIDKILKDFITEETKATDMRILSIRHFLATLNKAVDKYLEESEDTYENEDKKRLVTMLDDMAEIYRNEISDLLLKRGKLQHYVELFSKDVKAPVSNTEVSSINKITSSNNYIN